MITPYAALAWTERLIGIAILLQSLEMLQIRETFGKNGVWSWRLIREDFQTFPAWVRACFDLALDDARFPRLLWVRLFAALMLWVVPGAMINAILLLSTALIAARWRGSFNGGSDFMTLVVFTGTTLARAFHHPKAVSAALCYIALHVTASYFVSGLIKIKRANWRSGAALAGFLRASIYGAPDSGLFSTLARSPFLARAASWGVLAFECGFPSVYAHRALGLAFLSAGVVFHALNAYALGLNRFFFAWIAAYPAVIYCSEWLLHEAVR